MPHKIRDLIPPHAKSPKCYGTGLKAIVDRQLRGEGYSEIRKAVESLEKRLPQVYPEAPTRIGIEVEVENIRLDRAGGVTLPWSVKGDGSLRNNGAEFISIPILPQDVSLSVAALYGYLRAMKMTPDFSWRTSTHVHLEANQMSVAEFKNFLLLYLIFEDSLFEFARPGRRETNIFCTPLSRTDYHILRSIVKADDDNGFVQTMNELPRRILKYSALNLSHIFGYGTVEFRHLGGEKDPEKVCAWLQLILRLFESASRMDRRDIERNVRELNTNSFYRHFLSDVFGDLAGRLETNRRDLFLSNGVTVCKEILAADSPIPRLPKGQKSGLEIFGEAEAKKQVSDPLELKRQSLDREVEVAEVAAQDAALLYVDDLGRRHYAQTAAGMQAATRWWNPIGADNWVSWATWRLEQPDFQGLGAEERRWQHNRSPRNVFNPI